jgi:tetratricopeptide (TPR) repeat protein
MTDAIRLSDGDVATNYRRLLREHVHNRLDAAALDRHVRCAASVLFQSGLSWQKQLLLDDIMNRFEADRSGADPAPAFFASPARPNRPVAEVAKHRYGLALTLAPNFAEACYALAILKWREGTADDVIRLFRAAVGTAMTPHPGSPPHANLAANALWNLAEIHRTQGRNDAAETYYQQALSRLGNFGVSHIEVAKFFRQRGAVPEAASHYERIMPYSHLYAAEFVEPVYGPDERVPNDSQGNSCDPLTVTPLESIAGAGTIVYWWHLYAVLPPSFGSATGERLAEFFAPMSWTAKIAAPFRKWTERNNSPRFATSLAGAKALLSTQSA